MHINPINNSQTSFEARCFNAKHKGKARLPHPLYRGKPKSTQQTHVFPKIESNDVGKDSGIIIFRNYAYNPDYDWRLDTNHICHGKEMEPPEEFFEALIKYYKSFPYHGLDYEPLDELYDDDII